MSSFPTPSEPSRFKPIPQHDLVNCQGCNRNMIPRVVTYYGQPYQSLCPFCGTSFNRFPCGLQKLLQPFQSRALSWQASKWLFGLSLCFGFMCLMLSCLKLSNDVFIFASLGGISFTMLTLAELFVQAVERLSAKLSHESNYYWAVLLLAVMVLINFRPAWANYFPIIAGLLLLRWILLGSVRAICCDRSS